MNVGLQVWSILALAKSTRRVAFPASVTCPTTSRAGRSCLCWWSPGREDSSSLWGAVPPLAKTTPSSGTTSITRLSSAQTPPVSYQQAAALKYRPSLLDCCSFSTVFFQSCQSDQRSSTKISSNYQKGPPVDFYYFCYSRNIIEI